MSKVVKVALCLIGGPDLPTATKILVNQERAITVDRCQILAGLLRMMSPIWIFKIKIKKFFN